MPKHDADRVDAYINKYTGKDYAVEEAGMKIRFNVAPPVFDSEVQSYNHSPESDGPLNLVDRFLSKIRYGNYAGAAYGGGRYSPGAEPVDMVSHVKDEFDAVARTHDFEYYLVEREFMENKESLGEVSAAAIRARNLAKADREFIEIASGVKADTWWGETTRLVGIWALNLHSQAQLFSADRIEARIDARPGYVPI